MRPSAWLLAALASGSALAVPPLYHNEQSCSKFPTPSAQAECREKQKQTMEAFEKERRKKSADVDFKKRTDQPAKKDLCFTRQSTGETVCPN
ncbi:MAG: hypothetical protein ACOYNB_12005 [Aquabacterium sp.]